MNFLGARRKETSNHGYWLREAERKKHSKPRIGASAMMIADKVSPLTDTKVEVFQFITENEPQTTDTINVAGQELVVIVDFGRIRFRNFKN